MRSMSIIGWPPEAGARELDLQVRDEEPEHRGHPGAGGTRPVLFPKRRANAPPCSGAGATEGTSTKSRGFMAALDRDNADRSHHVIPDRRGDASRRSPGGRPKR